jgi:uncharacterized membrane protein
MTWLQKARLYGGIGSIILLIAPFVSGFLDAIFNILSNIIGKVEFSVLILSSILPEFVSIVGYILILKGVKLISEATNERAIFNNVLYAIMLFIIGPIAVSIGGLVFLYDYLKEFLQDRNIASRLSPEEAISLLCSLLLWFFILIVLIAIFYIAGAIFLRKGFYRIAELVKIEHFRTVGLLYFIGSILMVILIGGIIIFIANIFMIIAFFSIRERPPHIPPTPV